MPAPDLLEHRRLYAQPLWDRLHLWLRLERTLRPWAMGRKAWLFCASELAGQRAAMVMSLLQSAKRNGHDPWACLKDVLERLPTHPNHRIEELLPHRWKGAG